MIEEPISLTLSFFSFPFFFFCASSTPFPLSSLSFDTLYGPYLTDIDTIRYLHPPPHPLTRLPSSPRYLTRHRSYDHFHFSKNT
ncbi:MAG: hypothetical protein BYD32DRAFT_431267 [Podila humilis]|nr:MAG: hypothetical protein BYD32DRAFT_431267 [Podila humilis]